MIIGMGVDIAEVARIRAAIERRGQAFLNRIYTEKEVAYCERFKNKYERYAGRFAAKEAAMKALGTGWRHGVRWVDLEVVRHPSGRPMLMLAGEAGQIAVHVALPFGVRSGDVAGIGAEVLLDERCRLLRAAQPDALAGGSVEREKCAAHGERVAEERAGGVGGGVEAVLETTIGTMKMSDYPIRCAAGLGERAWIACG